MSRTTRTDASLRSGYSSSSNDASTIILTRSKKKFFAGGGGDEFTTHVQPQHPQQQHQQLPSTQKQSFISSLTKSFALKSDLSCCGHSAGEKIAKPIQYPALVLVKPNLRPALNSINLNEQPIYPPLTTNLGIERPSIPTNRGPTPPRRTVKKRTSSISLKSSFETVTLDTARSDSGRSRSSPSPTRFFHVETTDDSVHEHKRQEFNNQFIIEETDNVVPPKRKESLPKIEWMRQGSFTHRIPPLRFTELCLDDHDEMEEQVGMNSNPASVSALRALPLTAVANPERQNLRLSTSPPKVEAFWEDVFHIYNAADRPSSVRERRESAESVESWTSSSLGISTSKVPLILGMRNLGALQDQSGTDPCAEIPGAEADEDSDGLSDSSSGISTLIEGCLSKDNDKNKLSASVSKPCSFDFTVISRRAVREICRISHEKLHFENRPLLQQLHIGSILAKAPSEFRIIVNEDVSM
ncbi:hypothetical protein BDR26DRAFT_913809, partial [Obelidium mucronatum]